MLKNNLLEQLRITHPIIQAPMAGGITTSKLVAEVSNSGGLGMIGAGYMSPEQMKKQILEIKNLTTKPFGVNLFVPQPFSSSDEQITRAQSLLQPFHEQLKLEQQLDVELPTYSKELEKFYAKMEIVIEHKLPICSFTFGIPPQEIISKLKAHQITTIGTATTVAEAKQIEESDMDVVVVQGSEAGGHRGHFLHDTKESLIGLMSLIPQVQDEVKIPIVAAGGIMDGRGLMAALVLGASAVQMGTAFLTTVESGANKLHKKKVLQTTEEEVILTRAFSGKDARGIKNTFTTEMEPHEGKLPPFPIQNTLTKDMRKKASAQGVTNYMSLWSGQSPRLATEQSVKELIKKVISEAEQLKEQISK